MGPLLETNLHLVQERVVKLNGYIMHVACNVICVQETVAVVNKRMVNVAIGVFLTMFIK